MKLYSFSIKEIAYIGEEQIPSWSVFIVCRDDLQTPWVLMA